MAGAGQGLDWGPPIGAIGIPFNTITDFIVQQFVRYNLKL